MLLDDDLHLLVEAGLRAGAERPSTRREREAAVGQLLADAESDQPAQEAEEMRRREIELAGKLLGRPGMLAHPVGQSELDRGIGERGCMISFDLKAQARFESFLIDVSGHCAPHAFGSRTAFTTRRTASMTRSGCSI